MTPVSVSERCLVREVVAIRSGGPPGVICCEAARSGRLTIPPIRAVQGFVPPEFQDFPTRRIIVSIKVLIRFYVGDVAQCYEDCFKYRPAWERTPLQHPADRLRAGGGAKVTSLDLPADLTQCGSMSLVEEPEQYLNEVPHRPARQVFLAGHTHDPSHGPGPTSL